MPKRSRNTFFFLVVLLSLAGVATAADTYPGVCSPKEAETFLSLAGKSKRPVTLTAEEMANLEALFARVPLKLPDANFKTKITAVARWFQLLPCNPQNLPNPITLILSSENHSKKSPELLKSYLDRAAAHEILFDTEAGLDRHPDETPHEYHARRGPMAAAEGLTAVGVAGAVYLANDWRRAERPEGPQDKLPDRDPRAEFAVRMGWGPILDYVVLPALNAPDSPRGAPWALRSEEAREFIAALIHFDASGSNLVRGKAKDPKYESEEKNVAIAREALKQFAAKSPKVVESAWSQIQDYWANRITSDRGLDEVAAPIIEKGDLIRALAGDRSQIETLAELYVWKNRARGFANRALEDVCETLDNPVKSNEIVMHVGAGHTPAVFELIATALKKSDAGKNVILKADVPSLYSALEAIGNREKSDDLGAPKTSLAWDFLRNLPSEPAHRDRAEMRTILYPRTASAEAPQSNEITAEPLVDEAGAELGCHYRFRAECYAALDPVQEILLSELRHRDDFKLLTPPRLAEVRVAGDISPERRWTYNGKWFTSQLALVRYLAREMK